MVMMTGLAAQAAGGNRDVMTVNRTAQGRL
jgi:hypothetical protein